jgi:hypothetical protein
MSANDFDAQRRAIAQAEEDLRVAEAKIAKRRAQVMEAQEKLNQEAPPVLQWGWEQEARKQEDMDPNQPNISGFTATLYVDDGSPVVNEQAQQAEEESVQLEQQEQE